MSDESYCGLVAEHDVYYGMKEIVTRTKVFGGWLVSRDIWSVYSDEIEFSSTIFVADPTHCWLLPPSAEEYIPSTYTKIIKMANEKTPQNVIARELGLSVSTVNYHIQRAANENLIKPSALEKITRGSYSKQIKKPDFYT